MADKATEACKLRFGLKVSGADGALSKRVTWCCRERHGFMLKHWKCVGWGHAECPMTNGELAAAAAPPPPGLVDAGETGAGS
jgi:hypothetical protein